ncbi:hypothetical protein VTI28DRAFT_5602 [Corynascus sepedonium]
MNAASIAPHRKRKRAPSDAVINPLSHPPETLRQFAVAGYPVNKPVPSKAHPGFPHRAPRPRKAHVGKSALDNVDDDAEGGDETATAFRSAQASDADGEQDEEEDYYDTAGTTDADSGWRTTDGETTEGETDHHHQVTGERGRKAKGKGKGRGKGRETSASVAVDRRAHAYRARVGWLTAVIRRCLAEGDVATAKRAFGLLLRARAYGRKVDLRWERYWEMGAEILMREGEAAKRAGAYSPSAAATSYPLPGDGETGGWEGADVEEDENEEVRTAKLARLRAYYEYLIQQYPYSKQHPGSANNVLDFQVALFSAEMEEAHAAHRRGLERLQRGVSWEAEAEEEDEEKDIDVDEPMDYDLEGGEETGNAEEEHLRGLSRGERRLRRKENNLRLEALRRMTDIARRMDTTMETVPFSRDHELLRLRAMVALYIGDLYMPPSPRSAEEDKEGKTKRAGQHAKAKRLLQQIKETGGGLGEDDEQLLESLVSDDDDDTEDEGRSVLPMFSSMRV